MAERKQHYQLLLVDDDDLVRRSVERILTRAGHQVVWAATFQQALEIATRVSIDAALVDFTLADDDGLQLLGRLKEIQPACLRILMTGRSDFPLVVEALNRGEVLKVLRKPFDASGLLRLIDEAFDSARRFVEIVNARQTAQELQERAMFDEALLSGQLGLAVQPIVHSSVGHPTVAFEALLRSRHPVLDGPASLLRVAERTDRIADLGKLVFSLAAARLTSLPIQTSLFVNLHPKQLADIIRLEQDISPLLPSAERITLEITERSRLDEILGWDKAIDLLVHLGFSVAIDDLGAGYNSLSMLADIQPRYIKLDMGLVRNVNHEPRKQRLVALMATFADATNATLIAEGVETVEEANALVDCGTHMLQGYYFGRPIW